MKGLGTILGLMILLLIGALIFKMPGCQQTVKHMTSSVTGLDRIVTLYSPNGTIIKTWDGRIKIEEGTGGKTQFILNNKVILISGTYIIEEQ